MAGVSVCGCLTEDFTRIALTIDLEYEAKTGIAEYLTTQLVNSTITTLQDIVNFNEDNADLEFPGGEHCCQISFLHDLQSTTPDASAEYWKIQYELDRLYDEQIMAVFRLYDLDVLLVPTRTDPARLGTLGRAPVGTVPLGYQYNGLPFGMSFAAKPYDEPTVLRAMYAWEANFPKRKVPSTLE